MNHESFDPEYEEALVNTIRELRKRVMHAEIELDLYRKRKPAAEAAPPLDRNYIERRLAVEAEDSTPA